MLQLITHHSFDMKRILVLCTGNSARSQIAEGYLQTFAGDRAEVYSAGVAPHGVNPLAIQVMAEDGIDISRHTSNHVDEYTDKPFDYVITVCDNAREQCPLFPASAEKIHHSFPDPGLSAGTFATPENQSVQAVGAGDKLTSFYQVRDLIKAYSLAFVKSRLGEPILP